KLSVGMPIVAEWGGTYFHATIVSLESDGRVKVHYDGWSDSADEVIARDKVYYDPSQPSANAAANDQATPGDGVVRVWTDSTGKPTSGAEWVGNARGGLKRKRKDGKVISIPIEKVSEADQQRVK